MALRTTSITTNIVLSLVVFLSMAIVVFTMVGERHSAEQIKMDADLPVSPAQAKGRL